MIYQDPEQLKVFISGMDDFEKIAYEDIACKFDFSPYKTVLDLGGAGAELSIALAKKYPQLTFETLDLPQVQPIA